MTRSKFILDTSYNTSIIPDDYLNEYQSLISMRYGLIVLYNQVRPAELAILKEANGSKWFFAGNYGYMSKELNNLLPSFFHWFGNTVINYARLNGYLVAREEGHITEEDLSFEPAREKIRLATKKYLEDFEELQDVLKWRNKVSAHFALTDPRKEDNIATMESSILSPVSFDFDRFRTHSMVITRGDAQHDFEPSIPCWSLTEVFEKVKDRIWPDIQIK
jgi:hypothetical protein